MWLRSKNYISALGVALIITSLDAGAQLAPKMYRIGWLGSAPAVAGENRAAGEFQQGLRDLKYVDGQNIVLEYRHASGNTERLSDFAAELVRSRVDVIVTAGEQAALAAKAATSAIPIVVTEFSLDPIKAGLVASLGRPGGNVTGLATQSEELWEKRLGLLKEVAPKASRLAVIWNPANPGNVACVGEITLVGAKLGLQLNFIAASDTLALQRAFDAAPKEFTDAVAVCWDSVMLAQARAIADFASKHRVPTVAPLREFAQAGALLSFGSSLPAQRRRAAYYVDRILKGAKPADLPVERPSLFELVVNAATAKSLGLVLPPSLLVLADDLIQ